MPTVITGTDGINQVQAGAVESGDLPAGSVIQVVSVTKTDTFSTTSTSFVDVTGLSANITPTSATNKILIISNVYVSYDDSALLQLLRDATPVGNGSSGFALVRFGATNEGSTFSINHLDSPNSTSSLTYKIQAEVDGGSGGVFINRRKSDGLYTLSSHITLMEIAG